MVLTNVRELAMLMLVSVAEYFGSGSLFCVLCYLLIVIDILLGSSLLKLTEKDSCYEIDENAK